VNSLPATPTISNSRPLTFCSGDSTILSSSAATGNQWLLNGSNILGATGQTLVAKTTGSYTVRVSNANGCSSNSVIVGIVNNSTAGAGLDFRDSLICKATSLRVTAQAVSPTAFLWSGVRTGFSATTQSVNISNSDMYRVRMTLSNGCVVNDSINLRNTADTAIKAKIAMTKQAFVNQQILAVNITSVKPQTQSWVFPVGSTVISQFDSLALLRFAAVGSYRVILNNTSYNVCKSTDTARVVVTTNDYPATTSPPTIIIRNITIGPNPTTGISNITVDLNRPGNITMRIFNFNGTLIYNRTFTNTNLTKITEQIDISSQPSNNTYILVVQSEGSNAVRSIFKN
ncbi:MAG: T9SS C-terminal target domain-containing protein, partial [Sphingobacteriia bacterium]